MAELVTSDVTLHVEVDGDGEPVMVLAHGLTNSCRELAMLTGFVPGTKVRFCFRGHGHSSSPATRIPVRGLRPGPGGRSGRVWRGRCHRDLAGSGRDRPSWSPGDPDRFRKLVFLLPAGLDRAVRVQGPDAADRGADGGKRRSSRRIEALLSDPARLANYAQYPWLRDIDRADAGRAEHGRRPPRHPRGDRGLAPARSRGHGEGHRSDAVDLPGGRRDPPRRSSAANPGGHHAQRRAAHVRDGERCIRRSPSWSSGSREFVPA